MRSLSIITWVIAIGSVVGPTVGRTDDDISLQVIVDLPLEIQERFPVENIPLLRTGGFRLVFSDSSDPGRSISEADLSTETLGVVTLTKDAHPWGDDWQEYRYLIYESEAGLQDLPPATMISFFARRTAKFAVSTDPLLNPYLRPISNLAYYGSGDANLDDDLDAADLTAIDEIIAGTRDSNEMADTISPRSITADDRERVEDALNGTALLPSAWVSQTEYPRNQWLRYTIGIDTVNHIPYSPPWVCMSFASLLQINYAGFEGSLAGTAYDPDDPTIHAAGHIFPGRFNLPMYYVDARTPDHQWAHAINAILMGDDPRVFTDWRFIEPQQDRIDVQPGYWDLPLKPQGLRISISFPLGFSGAAPSSTTVAQFMLYEDASTELIYIHPDLVTPLPSPPPTPTPTPTPEICTRLDERFDGFATGTRPLGWTFTGCDQDSDTYATSGDYGFASPSIKLDATGDRIETAAFGSPDWLQFWCKGQGTAGTSHLLVEEYYSAAWSPVSEIFNLPAVGTTIGFLSLHLETTRLRFTYHQEIGDLGLDDVLVKCLITPLPSSTPTPPPSASPTPTSKDEPTPTPTPTASPFRTPPPSTTPPPSASPTPTSKDKPSPTFTPTVSPFRTPTPSTTPSPSFSRLLYRESGDYDGDGAADIAAFRSASGLWAVRGVTRVYFGQVGDLPASGDYLGNGTTEIGVFRGDTGLWAIRGVSRWYFGTRGDIPVPGDYLGNGTSGIGIFRESSGLWAIKGVTRVYFGSSGDYPIPGYYSGDRSRQFAVFRPNFSLWAIRGASRIYFGIAGDIPVPGDYTGSGNWGPAIFRPGSSLWAIKGRTRIYFGKLADWPVPADYDGDRADEIGVFRDTAGLWVVPGITKTYYGSGGDIPLTR